MTKQGRGVQVLRWAAVAALVAAALVPVAAVARGSAGRSTAANAANSGVASISAESGVRFEANQGQFDEPVRFVSRGPGYTLYLAPTEAVMSFNGRGDGNGESAGTPGAIRMALRGGNPAVGVNGDGRLSGVTHYLKGRDGFVTGVPSFARVTYEDLYPGIDLLFRGNDEEQLEYDFLVSPDADPGLITLSFSGQDALSLAPDGALLVATAAGEVRQAAPVVFQEVEGRRRMVEGSFAIDGNDVGFRIGDYDKALPLTIDPILTYSTYLGEEQVAGIAARTDPASGTGYTYLVGETCLGRFPSTESAFQTEPEECDAFITKLDPDRGGLDSIVWSTYLGGAATDRANAVSVNAAGEATVVGTTVSTDLPTRNAYDNTCGTDGRCDPRRGAHANNTDKESPVADGFLARLSADGSDLGYLSYVGGGETDTALDVAVNDGTAFVTGSTDSPDFPVTPDGYDLACGTDSECDREVEPSGVEYREPPNWGGQVGGLDGPCYVEGTRDPTPRDCRFADSVHLKSDFFVAAFDMRRAGAEGLRYSTFLGDENSNGLLKVAADPDPASSTFFVAGTSWTGVPTSEDSFQKDRNRPESGFVMRFDLPDPSAPTGGTSPTTTVLGTYFPAPVADIAVDVAGHPYLTGADRSGTVSTTEGAYQQVKAEGADAFLTGLPRDLSGPPVYSTYLGGNGDPRRVPHGSAPNHSDDFARSVTAGSDGQLLIAGRTGSRDFPTTADAFAREPECEDKGYCVDAFVAAIDPGRAGDASLAYGTYLGGPPHSRTVGPIEETVGASGSLQDVDVHPTPNADSATAIAADSGGGIHVAGTTETKLFPWVNALRRAPSFARETFVAKFAVAPANRPYIREISPRRGPTSGGTPIILSGVGLGATTAVRFGDTSVPCPSAACTVDPSGFRLVVTTPLEVDQNTVLVTAQAGTLASPLASFSVFTFDQGSWASTTCAPGSECPQARTGHTATALPGGQVLLVGGFMADAPAQCPHCTAGAYLYDPKTGHWDAAAAETPNLPSDHTATLLNDDRVLVAGGWVPCNTDGATTRCLSDATLLYDPSARTWYEGASLNTPRAHHSATLLEDGSVLVVGGEQPSASLTDPDHVEAERYDPGPGGAWVPTLPAERRQDLRRRDHTSTVLGGQPCAGDANAPDCGKVLVVGGRSFRKVFGNSGAVMGSTHVLATLIYDPETNAWQPGEAPTVARADHSATMLRNGRVMITGGELESLYSTDTVEVYDPDASAARWSFLPPMHEDRRAHAAVTLGSDDVLTVGGAAQWRLSNPFVSSAELYSAPAGETFGRWRSAASLLSPRHGGRTGADRQGHVDVRLAYVSDVEPTATLLSSDPRSFAADPNLCGSNCGKVLVITGAGDPPQPFGTELYTPPPTVADIEPASGAAQGGETITIRGSGFAGDMRVLFGGSEATDVKVLGYDTITAVVPPAADGEVARVVVARGGVGVGVSPDPFTYVGGPAAVQDLRATAASAREIKLEFSATGTTGRANPAAGQYVIKHSRTPIDDATFEDAPALCGGICSYTPGKVGAALTLSVADLMPDTTYYFALKAADGGSPSGALSNVASETTGPVPPDGVAELLAEPVSADEIKLTFSVPGANRTRPPPARSFTIVRSSTPITGERDFEQATGLCQPRCTFPVRRVGDEVTLSAKGLRPDTKYYFAVRPEDAASNVGPISRSVAASTPAAGGGSATSGSSRCPDLADPTSHHVAYPAGYSLVSLPGGTRVGSQSPLYGWFDSGAGGAYSVRPADEPTETGLGYWAWFRCGGLVELADNGVDSVRFPLGGYHASMVGNPSGRSRASVSGHDFAASWDQTLNDGAGGYRMSEYQQPVGLGVGEGTWVFSYRDTDIDINADSAAASAASIRARGEGPRSGEVSVSIAPRTASNHTVSEPSDDEARRGFTVKTDEPVRIALFPCASITREHGAPRYLDADSDNHADGIGTTETGAAALETVNDEPTSSSGLSETAVPTSGQVTFTLDATQPDCAVPVAFADGDGDGALDLDHQNRMVETAAVAGRTTFHTNDLNGTSIPTSNVVSVDRSSDSFVACRIEGPGSGGDSDPSEATGPCRTISYDANDSIVFGRVAQDPGEAGIAALEASLSVDDDISGTYYSDGNGSSTLDVIDEAPNPPNELLALPSPDSPRSSIVLTFPDSSDAGVDSYTIHRAKTSRSPCPATTAGSEGTVAFPNDSYTSIAIVPDISGNDANEHGYRFVDTDLKPGRRYCYAVTSVDDDDVSRLGRQSDGGGGPNSPVETQGLVRPGGPVIARSHAEDRGASGMADAGDVHQFSFTESLSPEADDVGSSYRVKAEDGTEVSLSCGTTALCFLNPPNSPGDEGRPANEVLRVFLTSNTTLRYPVEIVSMSEHFRDGDEGLPVDLGGSDVRIEPTDSVGPNMVRATVTGSDRITVEYNEAICAAASSAGNCGSKLNLGRFRFSSPATNSAGCAPTGATFLGGDDDDTVVLSFPTTPGAGEGCRGLTGGLLRYIDSHPATLAGDIVNGYGHDAASQNQVVGATDIGNAKANGRPVIIGAKVTTDNEITVSYNEPICASKDDVGTCGGTFSPVRFVFTSAAPGNECASTGSRPQSPEDATDELVLVFTENASGCEGITEGHTAGSLRYMGHDERPTVAGMVVDATGERAPSQVHAVEEPGTGDPMGELSAPVMIGAKVTADNEITVSYNESICVATDAVGTCGRDAALVIHEAADSILDVRGFSLRTQSGTTCGPSGAAFAAGPDDKDKLVLSFTGCGAFARGALTYVDPYPSTYRRDIVDEQGNDALSQTIPVGGGDVPVPDARTGPVMVTTRLVDQGVVVGYSEPVCASNNSGQCGGEIDATRFRLVEVHTTGSAVPGVRCVGESTQLLDGSTVLVRFEGNPLCSFPSSGRGTLTYLDADPATGAGDIINKEGADAPTQTMPAPTPSVDVEGPTMQSARVTVSDSGEASGFVVDYGQVVCGAGPHGSCGDTIAREKFVFRLAKPGETAPQVCEPDKITIQPDGKSLFMTLRGAPVLFSVRTPCTLALTSSGTLSYLDPDPATREKDVVDAKGRDAPSQTIDVAAAE